MKVAFLFDDPGYIGGAELTMHEFLQSAPDDITLTKPDDAETVVVGNCFLLGAVPLEGKRVIRFVHDMRGPGPIDSTERIFYSPLQRDRLGLDGELCPAPIATERFKPTRQTNRHREGAVTIGTFGHPGKGQQLLREWSDQNELLRIYGHGALIPVGPNLDYCGEVAPDEVPNILWKHETFVHLPSEVEAYGRGVVEAWAARCKLVVNRNVGALHWLENDREALESPAERFWEIVRG